MTERWLKAINEGKVVGSVMVDFRKAFNLVDKIKLRSFKSSEHINEKREGPELGFGYT